ncbi:MAG: hypothetical protein HC856_03845 [Pseudanabaena sp. RU_4_16]|nr:hypothetical protein [Pseudanabaena sp. RU_4_16]
MTTITLHPPQLLTQAQAIAQNPDDLQKFLIFLLINLCRAIALPIICHQTN